MAGRVLANWIGEHDGGNTVETLSMTRDQELWAMALHVEQRHGESAADFIAEQIKRNRLAGEQGGVDLWEAVGRRFERLSVPAASA